MRIGDIEIGPRVFVVAEVGSNHNGDFDAALRLVELAKEAGADAVKFQTYRAEKLIDKTVPTMPHVRGVHKTQHDRFKSLQFTESQWERLAATARARGILFFSTPFDEESADFLDHLVPVFKIASGDLTNVPLIRHVAQKGKPIILSTGMSTLEEIKAAVRELPQAHLALLHCVSAYPVPMPEANLRAIPFLQSCFPRMPIGYSDHTIGIVACLGAVALGAVVIEKHFTTDTRQPIGDHKLSVEPDDLSRMVEGIRALEQALGTGAKDVGASETALLKSMRRGLAAKVDIVAGTALTPDVLIPLRPLRGIPAGNIDAVVGKVVKRDLRAGEFVEFDDVAW